MLLFYFILLNSLINVLPIVLKVAICFAYFFELLQFNRKDFDMIFLLIRNKIEPSHINQNIGLKNKNKLLLRCYAATVNITSIS